MGIFDFFSTKKETVKIMVLGLDNAGKTSILKKISGENEGTVFPTNGFNIKNYEIDDTILHVWDIGGQKVLRNYWPTYVDEAEGIVFVIDSCDEKRLEESGSELVTLLEEPELTGVPLLIFANKQDLEGALDENEISEALCLDDIEGQDFSLIACSA